MQHESDSQIVGCRNCNQPNCRCSRNCPLWDINLKVKNVRALLENVVDADQRENVNVCRRILQDLEEELQCVPSSPSSSLNSSAMDFLPPISSTPFSLLRQRDLCSVASTINGEGEDAVDFAAHMGVRVGHVQNAHSGDAKIRPSRWTLNLLDIWSQSHGSKDSDVEFQLENHVPQTSTITCSTATATTPSSVVFFSCEEWTAIISAEFVDRLRAAVSGNCLPCCDPENASAGITNVENLLLEKVFEGRRSCLPSLRSFLRDSKLDQEVRLEDLHQWLSIANEHGDAIAHWQRLLQKKSMEILQPWVQGEIRTCLQLVEDAGSLSRLMKCLLLLPLQ